MPLHIRLLFHQATFSMSNKLLQFHWFDKDLSKILDRYDIHSQATEISFDRATSLAQATFKTTVAMVLLADFQTFRIKSNQPIQQEVIEKLFDLAHLLKEVDEEVWYRFSGEPFFTDSELWEPVRNFQFFNCQPIVNTAGVSIGWLCLFDKQHRLKDFNQISILKTMAEMVMDELELKLQIRKSTRIENEIIHLAAHDLKNPLSGILGITDHIVKQIHDSQQVEEICELIKDSSRRMLIILDDILKTGYLENGKIQLKVSPGRLAEVVEQVLSSNKAAALKKNQNFDVQICDEPYALIDKSRMIELLDNLVSNSIKYAPKNSEIKIKIWENEGDACFSIYNQGVGLSQEDQTNIFGKFSKLSAKPTGGETSTGLGLSIVKLLTDMHGGKIYATSEGMDKGVLFTLTVPAVRMVA